MKLIIAKHERDAAFWLGVEGEDLSEWTVVASDKPLTGKGRPLDRLRDRVVFIANPERDEWAREMTLLLAIIGGPVVHTDGKIYEGDNLVGEIDWGSNVPETRDEVRELGFDWRKKSLVLSIAVADCECGHGYEREHDHLDLNLACQVDGCECEAYSP